MRRVIRTIPAAAALLAAALLPVGAAHADTATLGPGSDITIAQDGQSPADTLTGAGCTLAYIVADGSGSAKGLTAGHCGTKGQTVFDADNHQIGKISQATSPVVLPGGLMLNATAPDWAVIDINKTTPIAASEGQIATRTIGLARVGDQVCGQGRTTGWKCGEVTAVSGDWITTTVHREPGDSGGPLYRPSDGAALGLLSNVSTPVFGNAPSLSKYYSLPAALTAAKLKLLVDGDKATGSAPADPSATPPAQVTPPALPVR